MWYDKRVANSEDNILAEVAAIRCATDGLRPSKVITHSHTFSLLEIQDSAFEDIKHALQAAGVLSTFYDPNDESLILPGVALVKKPASDPLEIFKSGFDDALCECGDLFSEHEKPPEGTPWDICSFPCLKCDCKEYVAE